MARAAGQGHASEPITSVRLRAHAQHPGLLAFGVVGLALAAWLLLEGVGFRTSGAWGPLRLDLLVFTIPVVSSALALIVVGKDGKPQRER
jgi:hypothetical protein